MILKVANIWGLTNQIGLKAFKNKRLFHTTTGVQMLMLVVVHWLMCHSKVLDQLDRYLWTLWRYKRCVFVGVLCHSQMVQMDQQGSGRVGSFRTALIERQYR